MQHHEISLCKRIKTIFKRLSEMRKLDNHADSTQEYKQLEVYLDQLSRELHHAHEAEYLARDQQRRNFGL
jgi:uncharacterized protein YukE